MTRLRSYVFGLRRTKKKSEQNLSELLVRALRTIAFRRSFFPLSEPSPAANMGDANLFSDTFTITDVNAMKYDRVCRLFANTENGDTFLHLDVNSDIFPVAVGDRLQLLLASTLSLDGTKDDGKGWRDVGRGEASVADDYDYVCHGKIYRFEEGDQDNM